METYEEFINNILNTRGRFACGDEYHERHHIVPKCMNGTNDNDNLIDLFAREHFIAHKLLALENPDNNSLTYAYVCMAFVKREGIDRYELTPEEYEDAKISLSKAASKRFSNPENCYWYGKKMPQEIRDKMSQARIGISLSEETKEKLRKINLGENNPNFGLKRSEETKRKISEARKGKPSNNPLGLSGPRKYVDDNGNALHPQVCQYTKDGLLINKFFNAQDAFNKTGIKRSAIANCLCGLSKTAGGYIWKKEDNPLTQDDIIVVNIDKRKHK